MARSPNPMDRLITLMSSAVSAGAEDAMRLATSLREGRIDLDEVQRWYEQRRDQSMDLMTQIGDELSAIRKEGAGRFIQRGNQRLAQITRRSHRRRIRRASASRRRISRGTHRSAARGRRHVRRRARA